MKELQRKIDKAFYGLDTRLDANNFGLFIDPRQLKVWDDPLLEEEEVVEEEEEDIEELNFSS